MRTLKIYPGDYLPNVINNAVKMAVGYQANVKFEFNDLEIVVSPFDTTDGVQARVDEIRAAKRAAYLASDQYRDDQERNRREVAEKQQTYDALWAAKERTLGSGSVKMRLIWLADMAEVADDNRIEKYPASEFSAFLYDHGYRDGEWVNVKVGKGKKCRMKWHQSVFNSPGVMERYLFGQAISMARSPGLYPHPMIADLARKAAQ